MTHHPFQPGVEVAVVTRAGYRGEYVSYRLAKVAKVYKTGKFILDGDLDRKQYTASKPSWGSKEWEGRASSSGYSRSALVHLVTDELLAEVAKSVLLRRAGDAISTLVRRDAGYATAEHCETLERIAAEMESAKEAAK